jgi:hypothetical protein
MPDIYHKLDVLYDLLVDNIQTFEEELIDLIAHPKQITNTNKFASLLSSLKNSHFIEPLLLQISLSQKGDNWLTDFLYAVINLLDESSVDDEFDTPENLIIKLEIWIFNNSGELSWKAANLLKFLESESAERIQLKKLEERDDFYLTYVECILGLLRYNKGKHMALVMQIAEDETRDQELREFCKNIINRSSSDQISMHD